MTYEFSVAWLGLGLMYALCLQQDSAGRSNHRHRQAPPAAVPGRLAWPTDGIYCATGLSARKAVIAKIRSSDELDFPDCINTEN